MNQKHPSSYYLWFYGIALFVSIAGIVIWRIAVFERQEASFQWPTATGAILQSAQTYVQAGNNSHYCADVTYQYDVNGTRYQSHRISLWNSDLSYNDPAGFVSSHPVGSEAMVYYDPRRPANAVLVPGGDDRFNKLVNGTGAIVILISLFGLFRCLRKRSAVFTLLNAPDAQTRTMELKRADIKKAMASFWNNFFIAAGFFLVTMISFMAPFLNGPSVLLEAPHRSQWPLILGLACVPGIVLFLIRAVRKGRCAECPLCGTILDDRVASAARCNGCGTQFIFTDDDQHSGPTTKHARPMMLWEFQTSRAFDVAGFMAFPILFVWLWAPSDKQVGLNGAILLTIVLAGLGAMFCFSPESSKKKVHRSSEKASDAAAEVPETGPYLLDLSIILSAPVALICCLLCLVWQRQVLGMQGLIAVAIGFPAAIGIVTRVCSRRFTRAAKSKVPPPPRFVPLILIVLWVVGAVVSGCSLVWIIVK